MINIGVIACGKIANSAHLPSYKSFDDAQIQAVADCDEEKAQKAMREFEAERFYSDYREMLEKEKLDGISICSHTALHTQMTIDALNAGVNVLVEKPIAVTVQDADKMIEAAKENKRLLMVEQALRFNPLFETLKKLMDEGVIGKARLIQCVCGHGGPAEWNPDASWFMKKEKGGGVLLDMGIHEADMLRWVLGKKALSVSGTAKSLEFECNADDNSIFTVEFEGGAIATVAASWTLKRTQRITNIFGEKGHIELNSAEEKKIKVFLPEEKEPFYPEVPEFSKYGPGRAYRHFVNCLQGKEECVCEGKDGRDSLEIVQAARLSSETGRKISIPISKGDK